jgi:hypothetical protein
MLEYPVNSMYIALRAMSEHKLRKRYGKARAPIPINLDDPKWAHIRPAFEGEPLSVEDSAAVLRWLKTGKDRPSCA